MFVVAGDFNILPYNLPNLQEMEGVGSTFPDFVNRQEEERLRKIFGDVFYEFMIAQFFTEDGDPIDENDIPEKWKNLRDGALYKHLNTITYRYKGFKAFLIPFIYASWTRYTTVSNTGIGTVVSNAENSTLVNPTNEITIGWNGMVRVVGNRCKPKSTLFGFLYNSGDEYMEALNGEYADIRQYLFKTFCPPELTNPYGL